MPSLTSGTFAAALALASTWPPLLSRKKRLIRNKKGRRRGGIQRETVVDRGEKKEAAAAVAVGHEWDVFLALRVRVTVVEERTARNGASQSCPLYANCGTHGQMRHGRSAA